jgi:hypothetical protein
MHATSVKDRFISIHSYAGAVRVTFSYLTLHCHIWFLESSLGYSNSLAIYGTPNRDLPQLMYTFNLPQCQYTYNNAMVMAI